MNKVRENFSSIWPSHVEGLIEFLARLRAAFDGDLDAVLVLFVIGSGAIPRDSWKEIKSFDDYVSAQERVKHSAPVNTLSISDITGVPRETVRRKVIVMENLGWLARDADGCWRVTPEGTQGLEPMIEYSLEYLDRLSSNLVRVLLDDARL